MLLRQRATHGIQDLLPSHPPTYEAQIQSSPPWDTLIGGGGLAGCALATVLARQGQRVLVLEARRHPRFCSGESLIIECSEVMRALAERFDLPELRLPWTMHQGTLHHIFDGDWMWMIPFGNHPSSTNPRCSVGLVLGPRRHPRDPARSAQDEIDTVADRFPMIGRLLHGATITRPWVQTGRVNDGSHQVITQRACLLGHAAGFVDPLFSKGLFLALSCVDELAGTLLAASLEDDLAVRRFEPLQARTLTMLNSADRLVSIALQSSHDPKLRAALFHPSHDLFGSPDFWRWFFEDLGYHNIAAFALTERPRHSPDFVARQHRHSALV